MYPWISLACFGCLVFVVDNRLLAYTSGIPQFGSCWTLKCNNFPKEIATAAAFSLGIYLSHIVFVEDLQFVESRIGFAASSGTDLISFAGSGIVSLSSSMFLPKSSLF